MNKYIQTLIITLFSIFLLNSLVQNSYADRWGNLGTPINSSSNSSDIQKQKYRMQKYQSFLSSYYNMNDVLGFFNDQFTIYENQCWYDDIKNMNKQVQGAQNKVRDKFLEGSDDMMPYINSYNDIILERDYLRHFLNKDITKTVDGEEQYEIFPVIFLVFGSLDFYISNNIFSYGELIEKIEALELKHKNKPIDYFNCDPVSDSWSLIKLKVAEWEELIIESADMLSPKEIKDDWGNILESDVESPANNITDNPPGLWEGIKSRLSGSINQEPTINFWDDMKTSGEAIQGLVSSESEEEETGLSTEDESIEELDEEALEQAVEEIEECISTMTIADLSKCSEIKTFNKNLIDEYKMLNGRYKIQYKYSGDDQVQSLINNHTKVIEKIKSMDEIGEFWDLTINKIADKQCGS